MNRVQAYRSVNGQIDTDMKRAKAHDIAYAFDQAAKTRAIGTSSTGTSKIDWHAAMEILDHYEALRGHLDDYEGWIEEAKIIAEKEEARRLEEAEADPDTKPIQTTVLPPSDDPAVNAHDKMINTYRESDDPHAMKPYLDKAKDRIKKSHGGDGELD